MMIETTKYLEFTKESRVEPFLKEVDFTVASHRAMGGRVVWIKHADTSRPNFAASLRRNLRKMKTAGRLVCYISGKDFSSDQTETLYLLHCLPEFKDCPELDSGDDSFTVAFLR